MLGIGLTFLKKIPNPHYYVVYNIHNDVKKYMDQKTVEEIKYF